MKKREWYVYILRCADGSLYTGVSTDVERRIRAHSRGKGSRILRGKLPVEVVHREALGTKSGALKREAQIKSWSRAKKLKLIEPRSVRCRE